MWRRRADIVPLVGRYSVGSDGVVYSGGMPLKPVRDEWVSIGGERRYVSYLVARAFVPNPEGREFVVHRNGDRGDNRAENLEWSDRREEGGRRGPKPRMVPVVQYSLDGDRLGVYGTVSEASERSGVKAGLIRSALRRGGGRSGGFFWSYL